jgi:two-component system, response regulator PdtaR
MMQIELCVRLATLMIAGSDDDKGPKISNDKGRIPDTGRGLRVLIVEDEALVAISMESALSEAGFEIVGLVDTEADAVAEAQRIHPDIVLLDITLREGDGIAAAKEIQTKLKTHIIFVSGNSDPTTLTLANKINASGFIRKPFVADRFAMLVLDAVSPKN